jgi:hypothetical protein
MHHMSPTPSAIASAAPTASGAATAAASTDMFSMIIPIILLFAGVYALWGAFTGKGKMFEFPDYKAEIHPVMKKVFRIFLWVIGPICLGDAAVEFLSAQPGMEALKPFIWVGMGLLLGAIVFYIVYWQIKFKKYRKTAI